VGELLPGGGRSRMAKGGGGEGRDAVAGVLEGGALTPSPPEGIPDQGAVRRVAPKNKNNKNRYSI